MAHKGINASDVVEAKVQQQLKEKQKQGPPKLAPEKLRHVEPVHVVPRVLPLLCHELMTCSDVFLRLNLHAFLHHFDHLSLVNITSEDALQFLIILFYIINGPVTSGTAISQLAFHCLCRTFTWPHAHHARFVDALQTLLGKLQLTQKEFYKRPPDMAPRDLVQKRLATLRDPSPSPKPKPKETDQRKAYRAALDERRLFLKEIAKVQDQLSEDDFLDIRKGFQDLDVRNCGRIAVDDLAAAGEEIAGRPFTIEMFKSAAHAQQDSISLSEVVAVFCPRLRPSMIDLFIRKAGNEPVHPDTKQLPQEAIQPLEKVSIDATATTLSPQEFLTLRLGYEQVVGGNVRYRLRLPALMAAGEMIAGNLFTKEMFNAACLQHGRNGSIAFLDVLREWMPHMPEHRLRSHFIVPDLECPSPCDPSSPAPSPTQASQCRVAVPYSPTTQWLTPAMMSLTALLERPTTRYHCVTLLRGLDMAGVFTLSLADPLRLHLYLPHLWTKRAKVYRDFITCPRRHRQPKPNENPQAFVHIKTNLKTSDRVMYRFVIEGYNYGRNASINSEIVGCTKWKGAGAETPGSPGPEGYPAGWDGFSAVDHAPGAQISQYFSSDGYVVLLLTSESFFAVGFSVSAWLVTHGFGADFPISASIHHQDDLL